MPPAPKPRPKSAKPPPRTDATTGAKQNSAPYVEPPPLELALKYPVEVWISCGEDFVKPQSKLPHEIIEIGSHMISLAVTR